MMGTHWEQEEKPKILFSPSPSQRKNNGIPHEHMPSFLIGYMKLI
jgi:hypothetical protein